MSLILWIASHHYNCRDLLDYVDDVFADDFGDHMVLYPRYRSLMPYNQFQLHTCFDDLRVPHDPPKQTCGVSQRIIGMQVDCSQLSITMPLDSRRLLIQMIDDFCTPRPRGRRIIRSLRRCQALAGHVNWALNAYPRLRPGLASLYAKMGGPYAPDRKVHINGDILRDLLWLVQCLRVSDGVFLLHSIAWTMPEADMLVFTDACLTGYGFWCPQLNRAYHAPTFAIPQRRADFLSRSFRRSVRHSLGMPLDGSSASSPACPLRQFQYH